MPLRRLDSARVLAHVEASMCHSALALNDAIADGNRACALAIDPPRGVSGCYSVVDGLSESRAVVSRVGDEAVSLLV